jgi:hypothetical protein
MIAAMLPDLTAGSAVVAVLGGLGVGTVLIGVALLLTVWSSRWTALDESERDGAP